MRKKKWTKNEAISVAKMYEYIDDFQKDNNSLYIISKRNDWIKDMVWLKYKRHIWNKERVFEEAKKYEYISDFRKHSFCAYESARRNNWICELLWLKTKDTKYSYCIYSYVDDENKVAYVGLTRDKITRHNTHKTGIYKKHICQTCVFKYFSEMNKTVPEPIYLEDNLDVVSARIREDVWKNKYIETGYKMLNKGKTGQYSGSIGGNVIKWTKDTVMEESKKYDSRGAFRKGSPTAYSYSLKYHLLDDMVWLKPKLTYWSKNMVFSESKKYNSRREFYIGCGVAYDIALRNGWLDEMIWLLPKYIIWNDELVIEESKKYTTRNEFRIGCPCGYAYARRNNLLNDFIWLKESKTGKKWSEEKVISIAEKYTSVNGFRNDYPYLYELARKKGWIKDIKWLNK